MITGGQKAEKGFINRREQRKRRMGEEGCSGLGENE
jgi:hypothetical protein